MVLSIFGGDGAKQREIYTERLVRGAGKIAAQQCEQNQSRIRGNCADPDYRSDLDVEGRLSERNND
jgi:hypothetical protein